MRFIVDIYVDAKPTTRYRARFMLTWIAFFILACLLVAQLPTDVTFWFLLLVIGSLVPGYVWAKLKDYSQLR